MRQDLIAGREIAGCRSDGRDDSGRLHPKRHRRRRRQRPIHRGERMSSQFPTPAALTSMSTSPGGELTRIGHINGLDGGTERADPGHAHVRNGKRLAT